MKKMKKEDLIIRDSMQLAFSGSEIWCEELDALNVYTDVVINKFLNDMEIIRKPSSSGLIAIHLNETLVKKELIHVLVTELKKAGHAVHKVVFVGLNRTAQKLMKSTAEKTGVSFTYGFNNDYEKSKEWLVS